MSIVEGKNSVPFVPVSDLFDSHFDGVIFINDDIVQLGSNLTSIETALAEYATIHSNLKSTIAVVPFPAHPSKRLIYSPTGLLNGDTDDSRNAYDAANAGIKKALAVGCRHPLLVIGPLSSVTADQTWSVEPYRTINVVMGAEYALYTPLEVREAKPDKAAKATGLGVLGASVNMCKTLFALAEGRRVARDIGGSDPERMAAPRIASYLIEEFTGLSSVQMTVDKVDAKLYPLMAAVDRAAATIERHSGRVVKLEYTAPSGGPAVDTSLFLVGKGITYDTGGADIKAGGVMAGMHRDKCGAAAVAGLLKTLGMLKPTGLSVSASLAFVRNSVGSNCYVADEIITSRANRRIRIGNTDAEGRMVMADLLCEMKEKAVHSVNPSLFTVATLTGHVIRAYKHYTAVMDNGPARLKNVSKDLQGAGDLVSDPAEVSTIRKEDYAFHRGPTEYEDVLQCNNLPSSQTSRGHQTPAAFLIMASGLDDHGRNSAKPLPYTHVDVAGSAEEIGVMPTGAPFMMFTARYILPRLTIT